MERTVNGYTELPNIRVSEHPVSASGINQIRYRETTAAGVLSIFAESSYEVVRIRITEPDGSKRQYRVEGIKLLDEISEEIGNAAMLDWRYLNNEDVEKETDTKIEVEVRVVSRNDRFGSVRMPLRGIDYLHNLAAVILSYAESEEDEVKPFDVTIAGKTYHTVRGTGNSAGSGAVIDFGDDKWWIVEGFTGTYRMTEAAQKASEEKWGNSYGGENYRDAFFELLEDGTVTLKVGDDIRKTEVSDRRLWGCYATAKGGISFDYRGSDKNMIEVCVEMIPAPVNFPGYMLYLERIQNCS